MNYSIKYLEDRLQYFKLAAKRVQETLDNLKDDTHREKLINDMYEISERIIELTNAIDILRERE